VVARIGEAARGGLQWPEFSMKSWRIPAWQRVIFARGRGGFEAYAADDHSLGLFPSPRKAAAAITMTRPWVGKTSPNGANNDCSGEGCGNRS
jgi:hypothetical protein